MLRPKPCSFSKDNPETCLLCWIATDPDGRSLTRSQGRPGLRPQRELSKLSWLLGLCQSLKGRSLGQNKISFLQGELMGQGDCLGHSPELRDRGK